MIFSKRIELGYDLFCTIWKGGIFSQKHGIFSRTENERERVRESEREREKTFLKKYTEAWYFLFDMFHARLSKKKIKDDPIPQKVTDTLD